MRRLIAAAVLVAFGAGAASSALADIVPFPVPPKFTDQAPVPVPASLNDIVPFPVPPK